MISIKYSTISIAFCFFFLINSVNAGSDIEINTQQILDEFSVQPERIKSKIKQDSKQLTSFIKAIQRESAFAHKAREIDLDKQLDIKNQIAIATRKVLVRALIDNKKQSIVLPDFSNMAKTQYEGHPEDYYSLESIKARHILIDFNDSNKQVKKEFLLSLIDKVNKGEDFSHLAKNHSTDKNSAIKGGELSQFTKGKMVKVFEDAAFLLREPNELSPIVETTYGFHLIQLIEYFPKKRREFSEVKEFIFAKMKADYIENEMRQWRKNIFDTAGKINPVVVDESIKSIQALPD